MKRTGIYLVLLFSFAFVQLANAYEGRTTGIGVRGTFWKPRSGDNWVHINTTHDYSQVDVGDGGGYVYLFSRLDDNSFVELTFGAVGHVESVNEDMFNTEVDVNAVTPLLLGLRHELFDAYSRTALQPYVAGGVGPYWFSDIFVRDNSMSFDEEVSVSTTAKFGGYLGGGFNFMLTDWLGLNFDVKYHFIDFNRKHEYSGYDMGVGLFFTWGRYDRPQARRYHDRDRDVTIHID